LKKWCLVILALMLCGCSASTKTAETEAVKNDRPVLRTETGSEEKNFTVFAMDTVMQFQIYGGNDDVEEKVRGKIEELEDTLSVTKEGSPMWNLNEKKNENFAEEFAKKSLNRIFSLTLLIQVRQLLIYLMICMIWIFSFCNCSS